MIRLHFVVEGHTEEDFVNRVLGPHLAEREVYCDVHRVTTRRARRGRPPFRGGMTSYLRFRDDLVRWTCQEQASENRFTTLVDLYRIPASFPGYDEAAKLSQGPARAGVLEGALAADIPDPRFIPYVQSWEFEALVFVDPARLGEEGAEDTPSEGAAPSRKTFFPSSAGLSVLVPPGATHLDVSADWGRYERLPLDESAELWANRPHSRRGGATEEEGAESDAPRGDDAEHEGRPLWQRISVSAGPLRVPLHDGAHWLPDTPDLEVVVRCKDAIAPGLPAGTRAVSAFVVNRRRLGETRAETDEATLFQFRLALRCDPGFQPRFDGSGERSEDPDERRMDLQYRDFGEWAVGHGTATRRRRRGPRGGDVLAADGARLPDGGDRGEGRGPVHVRPRGDPGRERPPAGDRAAARRLHGVDRAADRRGGA